MLRVPTVSHEDQSSIILLWLMPDELGCQEDIVEIKDNLSLLNNPQVIFILNKYEMKHFTCCYGNFSFNAKK